MRGAKPQAQIVPIGVGRALPEPPAWLGKAARKEWKRCAADLSRRGILFDGAMSSLATFCSLTEQIEQLAGIVAKEGLIAETGAHPAQRAMLAAAREARQLAAELGLSVVSRSRSFQGKAADEQAWSDLDVG